MTREAAALDLVQKGLELMVEGLSKLRSSEDWVDQDGSPLGKRSHLEAVRRGELPGHKVGHSVLVRRADLDAYILRHGTKVRPPTVSEEESEAAAIRAREEFVAPRRRPRKRVA